MQVKRVAHGVPREAGHGGVRERQLRWCGDCWRGGVVAVVLNNG